ncbi:MAG: translation initiation factor IF-2 [Hyphomicrobiaceae bacterium]|nr:translation initiation factor IF-2 [Hyphomicrobiaceae bacterium]
MTETKNTGDKTLHVDVKKTLTLKPKTDQSVVKQSFSHGRTKAVVVETKKKRFLKPGESEPAASAAPAAQPAAPRPAVAPAPAAPVAAAPRPVVPAPQPAPVVVTPVSEAPVVAAPAPAPVVEAAAPVVVAKPEPVAVVAPVVAEPAPAPVAPPVAAKPAVVVSPPLTRVAPPASPTIQRQPQGQQRAPGGQAGANNAGAQARQNQRPGQRPQSSTPRTGVVLQTLSADERAARERALADARSREADDRRRAEEEMRRRVEEDARIAREREEAERRRIEEEARKKAEEEARRRAESSSIRHAEPLPSSARPPQSMAPAPVAGQPRTSAPAAKDAADQRPARPSVAAQAPRGGVDDDEDGPRRGGAARVGAGAKRGAPPVAAVPKPVKTKGDDRGRGKLTVVTAQTGDEEEDARGRSVAAMRRRAQRHQRKAQGNEPREKVMREVVIPETITIQELANRMTERAVDVIKFLMRQGQMMKINDVIDADTAQLIAEEMGHTVKRVAESDVEEGLFSEADGDAELISRPPVVTIMGHVDHGKTSLLDALRHANVAAGEAGGITQHIGAYQVELKGQKITFIDTPGHEAFTSMRSRGAKATDIVILVVAADDGVMPTTIEAINHTRAAGVPMIVAINKIDKGDANPDRVRSELLQHEIVVESMGGDVLEVEVSATKKINLDKLLEAVLLQSEVLDLKAVADREADGTVIEARLDKGRGNVATVLVQRGTLKVGDIIVAGSAWGKIRALLTEKGEPVKDAGPSMPVEVLGFQDTPEAGDRFAVVESEARAREIADYRMRQKREKMIARGVASRGSLADMMSQLKDAGRKDFVLVVKGDVQGSVEAIIGALDKLGNDEVRARIIHSGAGGITESDVSLASASSAAIIGFNVRASKEAREAAEREGIEIRYYNIIYDLVDDVKQAMSGMLAPIVRETFLGNARIMEIFSVSKVGKIAGCQVTEGAVERGAQVRLIRDNVVIHEGKLATLKRFKDDASRVEVGQECGMSFEAYQDMRAGDVIECFRVEHVARSL